MFGCTTGQEPDYKFIGSWKLLGLQHTEINVIKEGGEGLLIGADKGVFQWNIQQGEFTDLGLGSEQIIGIAEFRDGELLVGTKALGFSSGETTLFRLVEGEKSWEPYMNNFGGETGEYTFINKGPLNRKSNSDTVWVRVGNAVAKSIDKGSKWELILGDWGSWGGSAPLFYLDPFLKDNIWVGGVSALSEAYLYRTTDNGDSWTDVTSGLSDGIEAVTYDAITFPKKDNTVLAGLSGTVREAFKIKKSKDMGENWNTVYDEAGIHCFTHSAIIPEIVYASGINTQGQLFFIASNDFGDTWQTIEYPESPTRIHVNDMVSVMEDGQEVIYLGTNKGLYSFTLE
jgi:hypothetical protein